MPEGIAERALAGLNSFSVSGTQRSEAADKPAELDIGGK